MKLSTSRFYGIAHSPWTGFVGSIASVAGFCWLVYDKAIAQRPGMLSIFTFTITLLLFLGIGFISARVRRENFAFRGLAKHLHKINHDYRNILHAMFAGNLPETKREKLIIAEEQTVRSVCQRIKEIIDSLIGKQCMVTVKLITEEPHGRRYCSTYVRSQENCDRDSEPPESYEIGTGKNIAFDTALMQNSSGRPSHFHSGDLLSLGHKYSNERQHWDKDYRSAIVVPIRAKKQTSLEDRINSDDIGFLCVDTMSKNRLNDSFHVDLLAAFADQMCNFFCLMRGKYSVLVDGKEKENESH